MWGTYAESGGRGAVLGCDGEAGTRPVDPVGTRYQRPEVTVHTEEVMWPKFVRSLGKKKEKVYEPISESTMILGLSDLPNGGRLLGIDVCVPVDVPINGDVLLRGEVLQGVGFVGGVNELDLPLVLWGCVDNAVMR